MRKSKVSLSCGGYKGRNNRNNNINEDKKR